MTISFAASFAALDELSCYLDSPAEPNNVHLEAWLPGRLDAVRLRRAVAEVLVALPSARRRRVPPTRWQRSYLWEVPSAADIDPVAVTSWESEADLAIARARFLARAPELDQAPVFRLLLASGPDRDCLIVNAHHAAFDGRSCDLLLRHVAAAYSDGDGGADDGGDGADDGDGDGGGDGDGDGDGGASGLGEPGVRSRSGAGPRERPVRDRCGRSARNRGGRFARDRGGRFARDPSGIPARDRGGRPVRVAAHPSGRNAPGYGYALLPWPGIPMPADGQRATVNDLLIATLITTIARWNADHGRRPGPVRLSMPIDARPPGREGDFGNLSRISPVTAMASPDLLAHVTAQTAAARQPDAGEPGTRRSGAQAGLARLWLPTAVKRRVYRAAVHLVGNAYSDTSLLTNLGNITNPPSFSGLAPDRMWFSTSAHMPRGLSVGAISVGGRLNLCFRHRYALLDDDAARAFAAQYADCLTRLSHTTPPPAS